VQEEVMTWFKGQAAEFCWFQDLKKCLDNAGDYVEK
jgi:hypothetical protein